MTNVNGQSRGCGTASKWPVMPFAAGPIPKNTGGGVRNVLLRPSLSSRILSTAMVLIAGIHELAIFAVVIRIDR